MLDRDLAELYNVETKYLKRQVRRNIKRSPEDFMFELTKKEVEILRCIKTETVKIGVADANILLMLSYSL